MIFVNQELAVKHLIKTLRLSSGIFAVVGCGKSLKWNHGTYDKTQLLKLQFNVLDSGFAAF